MQLFQQNSVGINITDFVEVLDYTYSENTVRTVAARVNLGATGKLIAGDGAYEIRMYVNDALCVPHAYCYVATGATTALAVSKPIPINSGDILRIEVKGQSTDTDVNVRVYLRDSSETPTEDNADGSIIVDHDYGGTDELAYFDENMVGIDNACIYAYLKSDYNNSRRAKRYIKGKSVTNVDGRWTNPMMLDPEVYILVYYKQGAFGVDTKEVTVTDS